MTHKEVLLNGTKAELYVLLCEAVSRGMAIGFLQGADTLLDPGNIALNGTHEFLQEECSDKLHSIASRMPHDFIERI